MDLRPYSEPKWYRKHVVKDAVAIVGIAGFLIGLASCGANSSGGHDGDTGDISVIQVEVGGNTYNCVHTDGYYDDSNECDFTRPVR